MSDEDGADGHDSCIECDKGKYSADSGQTVCQACEEGKFSDKDGADDQGFCRPCDEGKYSADPGQTACQNCDAQVPSRATSSEGATSKGECKCNAGYYKDCDYASEVEISCLDCPVGKYRATEGATSESECQDLSLIHI